MRKEGRLSWEDTNNTCKREMAHPDCGRGGKIQLSLSKIQGAFLSNDANTKTESEVN